MFGIFVDRSEHSSDLCAMASKVLWPLRATPETPTVRSGTFESCFQHLGSFCRVLCTCVRKMRSRVRRVCGARARTSWSFLPSFQSPGAAAAPPRRDLKWRQFFHRGLFQKKKNKNERVIHEKRLGHTRVREGCKWALWVRGGGEVVQWRDGVKQNIPFAWLPLLVSLFSFDDVRSILVSFFLCFAVF